MKRFTRTAVSAAWLALAGRAAAEPVPAPPIPVVVSEPRPAPEVVPVAAPPIVIPPITPPALEPKAPALAVPPPVVPLEPSAPSLPAPSLPTAGSVNPVVVVPIQPAPEVAPVPTVVTPSNVPASPLVMPAPVLPTPAPVALPEPAPLPVPAALPEMTLPKEKPAHTPNPAAGVKPLPTPAVPPPAPVPPPGDDTIKPSPVAAIKSAVVGTIMAASPAAAQEPKTNPVPAEVKATDLKAVETALKEEIKALKDEIAALKVKQSTQHDMMAGRADGNVVTPADLGVMKRLETLEASVKRIEDGLKQLTDKLASTTAGASPLAGVVAAGKSRVRLVNEYPVAIRIVVNGVSHPLEAKEAKSLDVTPGGFSYQLLAEGTERVSSTIKEGETVTLRIR